MVHLYVQIADPPSVHPACIIEELSQADGYFASQDTPPVLWYPYQVVLQPVPGMLASPISGHSQIVP
jgi:hypothetical protein